MCDRTADPNLSALTETAEVYGAGLSNQDKGIDYVPSVYVFVSRAEAAQAQNLYTAPSASRCALALAKMRLKGLPAKTVAQTLTFVSRANNGVDVRARRAILTIDIGHLTLRVEASLIFLRRGRAVCEIWTSGPWDATTRRTWEDAISAVSKRLLKSDR